MKLGLKLKIIDIQPFIRPSDSTHLIKSSADHWGQNSSFLGEYIIKQVIDLKITAAIASNYTRKKKKKSTLAYSPLIISEHVPELN